MINEFKILKVMVRFDDVSVLVPCTSDSMTIKQLMFVAANRYKKALGKPPDYGVNVFNLKSLEGGILDEDDKVFEVIDNKEQVVAVYEEEDKRIRTSRGDGRSSIETTSPDMSRKRAPRPTYVQDCYEDNSFMTRQTSEPVLSGNDPQMDLDPNASCSQDDTILSMRKFERSSTRRRCSSNGSNVNNHSHHQPQLPTSALPPLGFVRNASWRKSTFRGSKNVMNWVQNQQQQQHKTPKRTDPIGSTELRKMDDQLNVSSISTLANKMVVLENNKESLGIHVIPDQDSLGRTIGLLVHNVDKDGKIGKDGQIREKDCIVEINGTSLSDVTFQKAQSILREALNSSKLYLRVVPHEYRVASSFTRPPIPSTSTPCKDDTILFTTPNKLNSQPNNSHNNNNTNVNNNINVAITHVNSTKPFYTPNIKSSNSQTGMNQMSKSSTCSKVTQPSQLTNPMISSSKLHSLPPSSDKQQVQVVNLKIDLIKGAYGLGFSITTKDNVPHGQMYPIFIKHILSQGAAVDDGRLQAGDKILKVNGMDASTINQEEIVSYLRGIKLGGKVELIVERLIINADINNNNNCNLDINQVYNNHSDNESIHTFIISLSGNIGIGISVRGKTKKEDNGEVNDLGLFIKSIHPSGAAARDGRMREGDKILEINGESLLGLTNSAAREILRNAMDCDGPEPDSVYFVVERFAGRNSWVTNTPCSSTYKASKQETMLSSLKDSTQKYSHERHRDKTPSLPSSKATSPNDVTTNQDLTFIELTNNFSREAPNRQSVSERKKLMREPSYVSSNQRKCSSGNEFNETQVTLKKALSDESLVSHNTTLIKTPQIDTRTCGLMRDTLKKYTSVENMAKFNRLPMSNQKSTAVPYLKKVPEEDTPQINGNGNNGNLCSTNKNKFKSIFKNINFFKSKSKKENKLNHATDNVPTFTNVNNCADDKKSIIDLLTRKAPPSIFAPCKKDGTISNANDYDNIGQQINPNSLIKMRNINDASGSYQPNNFHVRPIQPASLQYNQQRPTNNQFNQELCDCGDCYNLHHHHHPLHNFPANTTPQLQSIRSRNPSRMANRNSQLYDYHPNYTNDEELMYHHRHHQHYNLQQQYSQRQQHFPQHLNRVSPFYSNNNAQQFNNYYNSSNYNDDLLNDMNHDYDDPFNETSTTLHHF